MTPDERIEGATEGVTEEPLVLEHALVLLAQYKRDLATAHLRIRELEADARLRSAELELRARLQNAQRFVARAAPVDDAERALLAFRPIPGSPGFFNEVLRHVRARRWLLSLSREQLGRLVAMLDPEQATQLRDVYLSWASPAGGAS